MKILTGDLRGRALATLAVNPALRPTADKVRKAILDILAGQIQNKNVLDLFSGTGALGFECLSCGAASVTFVEKHPAQAKVIEKNLTNFNLKGAAKVLCGEVSAVLERLDGQGDVFDLVMLDPPYNQHLAHRTLVALSHSKLVSPGGWVVAECFKKEALAKEYGVLELRRQKNYGDTQILFYYNPCP